MKKLRVRKHDLEFLKREFDSEVLQGVKGMISYFLQGAHAPLALIRVRFRCTQISLLVQWI